MASSRAGATATSSSSARPSTGGGRASGAGVAAGGKPPAVVIWKHVQGANFCPRCGSLLTIADSGDVDCDTCAYRSSIAEMPTLSVVTQSHSRPVPEWLVEYRATHGTAAEKASGGAGGTAARRPARAVVSEECPKCKAPTMEYYTMQLRSADEGQTVFYECTKCGHKYSVNT